MYTLAIEDTVELQVKLTVKVKSVAKLFSFTITATRMAQSEIEARVLDKENKVGDFLAEVITGWSGQRLVLADNGEPADFSADALRALLDVAGVANVIFSVYLRENGAKEKN